MRQAITIATILTGLCAVGAQAQTCTELARRAEAGQVAPDGTHASLLPSEISRWLRTPHDLKQGEVFCYLDRDARFRDENNLTDDRQGVDILSFGPVRRDFESDPGRVMIDRREAKSITGVYMILGQYADDGNAVRAGSPSGNTAYIWSGEWERNRARRPLIVLCTDTCRRTFNALLTVPTDTVAEQTTQNATLASGPDGEQAEEQAAGATASVPATDPAAANTTSPSNERLTPTTEAQDAPPEAEARDPLDIALDELVKIRFVTVDGNALDAELEIDAEYCSPQGETVRALLEHAYSEACRQLVRNPNYTQERIEVGYDTDTRRLIVKVTVRSTRAPHIAGLSLDPAAGHEVSVDCIINYKIFPTDEPHAEPILEKFFNPRLQQNDYWIRNPLIEQDLAGRNWADLTIDVSPSDNPQSDCLADDWEPIALRDFYSNPNVEVDRDGHVTLSNLEIASVRNEIHILINNAVGNDETIENADTRSRYPWRDDREVLRFTRDFLLTALQSYEGRDAYAVIHALNERNQMEKVADLSLGVQRDWEPIVDDVMDNIAPRNQDYSDPLVAVYLDQVAKDPDYSLATGAVLLFGRAGQLPEKGLCDLSRDLQEGEVALSVLEFSPTLSGEDLTRIKAAPIDGPFLPTFHCPSASHSTHILVTPDDYAQRPDRVEAFTAFLDAIKTTPEQ